ncbi:MAG: hypothetical protein HY747_04685 [Elusimicrobia bacterium]|nr:hypothetical protein [Elusimicrobiota bacterium]
MKTLKQIADALGVKAGSPAPQSFEGGARARSPGRLLDEAETIGETYPAERKVAGLMKGYSVREQEVL